MDKKRILIVDDELHIRQLVSRCLGGDYSVLEASNGEEAINIAGTQKLDLILLDIKLPGMSGIEFYRHIEKTNPALARKIIFITGDVTEATTKDFLGKTKAPYIAKPFNIEQLKKEINQILSKGLERKRSQMIFLG